MNRHFTKYKWYLTNEYTEKYANTMAISGEMLIKTIKYLFHQIILENYTIINMVLINS